MALGLPTPKLGTIAQAYFTGSGAWSLLGLGNLNFNTAAQELLAGSDGMVNPTQAVVMGQSPGASLTTSSVAVLLAKTGAAEYKVPQTTVILKLQMFMQSIASLGQRSAGATHRDIEMAKGLIIPRSIRASLDGDAQASIDVLALWDGTNDPLTIGDADVALPGTAGVAELFTVGRMEINGTPLDGIEEMTVDFGITVGVIRTDGNVWPTDAYVRGISPSFVVSTRDSAALKTLGLLGTKITADVELWFRKKLAGGGNTLDATAEHIKFTGKAGIAFADNPAGAHGGEIATAVRIPLIYDGTNPILGLSTAAAIA